MPDSQPIFNPHTGYRITLRGQVNVEWLQSFDSSVEIQAAGPAAPQPQALTVITVHADQSGIIGLVRHLHNLGLTIVKLELALESNFPPFSWRRWGEVFGVYA